MKTIHDIKKVGVVGGGVMGSGIALAAAMAGYQVVLFDINQEILDKAAAYFENYLSTSIARGKIAEEEKPQILSSILLTSRQEDVVADFIIEAILENLELKQKVLRGLEALNSEATIFASNTSTLPITRIGAGMMRPRHLIGMHFFNPAPIMKLVEVISGEETAPWVTEVTFSLAGKMHKKPVQVQDEPGFIVNRVARHFYLESLKVLEEKVASFEAIDRLMEASGFKMGPFRLMDLIGVETNHEVTKSLYESFFHDEKFRPSRVQQKKVDAGHFGRKSGRGFYTYES